MERIHDVDKLLQTGIEMMAANGYHNTSINAVIKKAQLPKGSFYYLYKDKKSFALDALRNYNDGLVSTFLRFASDETYTPLESIKRYFQRGIDSLAKARYYNGCFLGNMSQELSDIDEDFRGVIQQGFERLSNAISAQLKNAQAAGELNPGLDTDVYGDLIINAYHGALLRMKASKSKKPLDIFMNEFFSLVTCNV